MSYLVFARRWRPKNFDEVIGQEHIATTLKNAIALDRVAHAYLFSGPRGIGKTSTARILAKALNCEKGPGPNPCNTCDSCQEISEGRSLDVIEIDGASNRGIEQIRQLRENVKFAPAKGRFKIYIIDEVHQITPDGFNALLKTLEEPPAHIKFIFATTQVHKVLPTILSRCQRFDFKLLSVSFIVEKLKRIVKQEKLDVTDEAILYIARQAGGSMRDAESILDQLSSFCKGRINLETVTSILGTMGPQTILEISQKIIEGKTAEVLCLVEKIINEGKDLFQFIGNLIEQFRNILITKTISSKNVRNFIDLPQEYIDSIFEQARGLTMEEVFYIFNVLMRTQENLRRALSCRAVVEVAIIKLTRRENISSLEEILRRLARLEQNLNLKDIEPPVIEGNDENKNQTALKPAPSVKLSSDELNNEWLKLLKAVGAEKMSLASFLEFGEIASLDDNILTISFPEKYSFHRETLEHSENKKLIELKASQVFQRDLKVKFVLNNSREQLEEKKSYPAAQTKTSVEPIIKTALKIFQGKIVKKSGE